MLEDLEKSELTCLLEFSNRIAWGFIVKTSEIESKGGGLMEITPETHLRSAYLVYVFLLTYIIEKYH